MRRVAHISDIHFGRVDYATITPLIAAVKEASPDLVVISGDLTQRARESQFAEARHFLEQLPRPQIVVPGNHDVPLYNLFGRFFSPLSRYRRHISRELEPSYVDDEIAVIGINTARSLAFKNGRISHEQIDRIRRRFCEVGGKIMKVLVTHHSFDPPNRKNSRDVVGRARRAMGAMATCGADLLLAGHHHVGHTGDTACRYPIPGYSALVVHAGTATSTRGRGELNSFNLIRIEQPLVTIDRLVWHPIVGAFLVSKQERYEQTETGWETSFAAQLVSSS